MNQYPEQYPMDSPAYYPAQYQTMQVLEGTLGTVMGVIILIALGAWAFSLVKNSIKGEEVAFPLGNSERCSPP